MSLGHSRFRIRFFSFSFFFLFFSFFLGGGRLLPIVLAHFLASQAFFLNFIPKSTASIILDF